MSVLNPIQKQYEALSGYLESFPAVKVSFAAEKMKISQSRVEHSLRVMNKRGYFSPLQPYILSSSHLIVLDRQYDGFARAFFSADRTANHINLAQYRIENRAEDPERRSKARSKVVRKFMQDFADSGSLQGAGSFLRRRGAEALRDILSPSASQTMNATERTLVTVLEKLEQQNNAFLALQRQFIHLDYQNATAFLSALDYQMELVCTHLQKNIASNTLIGQELHSIAERLNIDYEPRYREILDDLHRQTLPPPSREDALIHELRLLSGRLSVLSQEVESAEMTASLQLLSERTAQILQLLRTGTNSRSGQSAVRSLRDCYLPLISELLTQYMQSLALKSAEAKKARMDTERIFATALPQAFSRILSDLETDSATDMHAQAQALMKKLQLDGILPYDFTDAPS